MCSGNSGTLIAKPTKKARNNGNCSAAVMGRTYAGPGATIGPALTFGYLAAETIAAEAAAGTATDGRETA